MGKHFQSTRLWAIGAASILALPFLGTAPAYADANFPSPEGETSTASILTYEDTIKELLSLEKTSRHQVDVFTFEYAGMQVNKSEQGRDLGV